jgi:hypothetical protein
MYMIKTALEVNLFAQPDFGGRDNMDAESPAKTMLRWTCRLRDVLERNYWVEHFRRQQISEMREAEFYRVDTNETTTIPDGLDWDALTRWYKHDELDSSVTLYNPNEVGSGPILDNFLVKTRSGLPIVDHGNLAIEVLWLSPNAFLSSFDFEVYSRERGTERLFDFEVTLFPLDSTMNISVIRSYSLATFEVEPGGMLIQPTTEMSLKVLRRLTASLSAGYFDRVLLKRSSHRFPTDCFADFLAVNEPNVSSPCEEWNTNPLFRVDDAVNERELQAILSYPIHPNVFLTICECHESLSAERVNALLLQHEHVRSIGLPSTVSDTEDPEETLPCDSITFESVKRSICFNGEILKTSIAEISKSHGITHTKVNLGSYNVHVEEEERIQSKLRAVLHHFLSETSEMPRLTVRFTYFKHWPDLKEILTFYPTLSMPCRSKKLIYLDIFFEEWTNQSPRVNMDCIENWDRMVAPALAVNYSREFIKAPLTQGLISQAIQRVNLGNVYQQVTKRKPCTLRPANAGVIFHLIQGFASCA